MAFKFIAVLAFVGAACAGVLPAGPAYSTAYHQPQLAYHQPQLAYHQPQLTYPAVAAAPAYVKAVAPAYVKAVAAPLVKQVEYVAPAKYDFSYGVSDPVTGDVKQQSESRDGDVVHGFYSLIDADGFKRTVEYTADAHNGFNAVVHREPLGHAAPVAKVVAPVAHYAAPAFAKVVAPAAYAAPAYTKYVAPATYAAPAVGKYVASYAAPAYAKLAAPVSYAAVAPAAKFVAPAASFAAQYPSAAFAPAPYYHH